MSLPDLGLRKLAMLLIRLYQVALSPFLPPGCRFVPQSPYFFKTHALPPRRGLRL